MEARSIDKKSLQLTDNGEESGQLVYENLFLPKAEIRLPDSRLFKITPQGVFGTSISVTENQTEIANLKMSWRGHIVFSFPDGKEYVLKAKGVFFNRFILEDQNAEKLIEFIPKFNWSKFDYNYDIMYDTKPQDVLLILLGIYACNYFIASMSGMMAVM